MVDVVDAAVQRRFKLLSWLLALPLAATAVFARTAHTGISPVNKIVETMAWLFNVPVLEDPTVQNYFVRFMLFILFLTIAHWSLKHYFDNKTSGVISSVFALIAAFLMRPEWVTANGGLITAIFTGLLPLGAVIAVIYIVVKKMNSNTVLRLLGIILLFLLLGIIDVYYAATGIVPGQDYTIFGGDVGSTANAILAPMLDWLSIAIIIAIIYMLFMAATGGEGIGRFSNLFGGGNGAGNGGGNTPRERGPRGDPVPRPGAPLNVHHAPQPANTFKVTWDPRPTEENIINYIVERKRPRFGWSTISRHASPANTIDATPGSQAPRYRVRSVNSYGKKSGWSESTLVAVPPPPPPAAVEIRGRLVDLEALQLPGPAGPGMAIPLTDRNAVDTFNHPSAIGLTAPHELFIEYMNPSGAVVRAVQVQLTPSGHFQIIVDTNVPFRIRSPAAPGYQEATQFSQGSHPCLPFYAVSVPSVPYQHIIIAKEPTQVQPPPPPPPPGRNSITINGNVNQNGQPNIP